MKILLDENIDIRFKFLFNGKIHEVFTVRDMNWLGVKNGELMKLLEENLFDIFIAVDKNLPYQQNNKKVPVLIIILDVRRNTLQRVSLLYSQILELISKPIQKEILILNE